MSMRVCLYYTNKYLLIREREEVGMVDFYGIAQEKSLLLAHYVGAGVHFS